MKKQHVLISILSRYTFCHQYCSCGILGVKELQQIPFPLMQMGTKDQLKESRQIQHTGTSN